MVCATPEFLAEHGVPAVPRDLEKFACVGFQSGVFPGPWSFASRGGGSAETVRPPMRLLVNNADVAVAAALAGHGIIRVLSYQVADEVRSGRLRILLAEYEPPPIPVHVVHLEGRRAAARVRAFVDFAAERLRATLSGL